MSKINDKIDEVMEYLNKLLNKIPDTLEEYKSDDFMKAACERYFEIIIEGITDISFMIITQKKFETPEDDIDSFRILADNKIIKEELYKKLSDAKGMRNFIAHQYGKINDKLVFEAIKEELGKDAREFVESVKKHMK